MSLMRLSLLRDERTEDGDRVGEIQIGDFSEKFHVCVDHWTAAMYLEHWRRSLRSLVRSKRDTPIVASMDHPGPGRGRAFLWLLYHCGESLKVQNKLHFFTGPTVDPGCVPSDWTPARATVTTEGDPISEWSVPTLELVTDVSEIGPLPS